MKKNILFVAVLVFLLILIIQLYIKHNDIQKHFIEYKCNTCDSLTYDKKILFEYKPIHNIPNKDISFIKKNKCIIEEGHLKFRGVDTYFFETNVSLGDSILIIDNKRKFLLCNFKRIPKQVKILRIHKLTPELKTNLCTENGCYIIANNKKIYTNNYIIDESIFYE